MSSSEAQPVTNPRQIAHLLKRLIDDHTLLTVNFPGRSAWFSSAVLAVDPNQGILELDELNPRQGHDLVQVGSTLRVEGRLQGVETRFVTEVREILLSNGIYYYRTTLPASVIHRQRREFHRVPVRLTLEHSLRLGEQGIQARVADLSLGGLGGVVVGDNSVIQGERYECQLSIGSDEPIAVSVEIRFAGRNTRGQQRFGAMFLDLPQTTHRRLARIIMELERELRRGS